MTLKLGKQIDYLSEQERSELEEFNSRVRNVSAHSSASKQSLLKGFDFYQKEDISQENIKQVNFPSNYQHTSSSRNSSTKKFQGNLKDYQSSAMNTPLQNAKNPWRNLKISTAQNTVSENSFQGIQNILQHSPRNQAQQMNSIKNGVLVNFETPIQKVRDRAERKNSISKQQYITPQQGGEKSSISTILSKKKSLLDHGVKKNQNLQSSQCSSRSLNQNQKPESDEEYLKLIQFYNIRSSEKLKDKSFRNNENQESNIQTHFNSKAANINQDEKSKQPPLLQQQQQALRNNFARTNFIQEKQQQIGSQNSYSNQFNENQSFSNHTFNSIQIQNHVKNRLQVRSIKEYEGDSTLTIQQRLPLKTIQSCIEDKQDIKQIHQNEQEFNQINSGSLTPKSNSSTSFQVPKYLHFQAKQDMTNIISPQFKTLDPPPPPSSSQSLTPNNNIIKSSQQKQQMYDEKPNQRVQSRSVTQSSEQSQQIKSKLDDSQNDLNMFDLIKSKHLLEGSSWPKSIQIGYLQENREECVLRTKDVKDRLAAKLKFPISKDSQFLISLIIDHFESCSSFALSLSSILA